MVPAHHGSCAHRLEKQQLTRPKVNPVVDGVSHSFGDFMRHHAEAHATHPLPRFHLEGAHVVQALPFGGRSQKRTSELKCQEE